MKIQIFMCSVRYRYRSLYRLLHRLQLPITIAIARPIARGSVAVLFSKQLFMRLQRTHRRMKIDILIYSLSQSPSISASESASVFAGCFLIAIPMATAMPIPRPIPMPIASGNHCIFGTVVRMPQPGYVRNLSAPFCQ